jgi:hypothetical protein
LERGFVLPHHAHTTIFTFGFFIHNLIVAPLHLVVIGKVVQTGAVTSPAAFPAAIGLGVIRLLRGGAATAARCILTSRARVGGLRIVVGFAHGYNITPKGAFVKGQVTHRWWIRKG